jgi:hypothetical protein
LSHRKTTLATFSDGAFHLQLQAVTCQSVQEFDAWMLRRNERCANRDARLLPNGRWWSLVCSLNGFESPTDAKTAYYKCYHRDQWSVLEPWSATLEGFMSRLLSVAHQRHQRRRARFDTCMMSATPTGTRRAARPPAFVMHWHGPCEWKKVPADITAVVFVDPKVDLVSHLVRMGAIVGPAIRRHALWCVGPLLWIIARYAYD